LNWHDRLQDILLFRDFINCVTLTASNVLTYSNLIHHIGSTFTTHEHLIHWNLRCNILSLTLITQIILNSKWNLLLCITKFTCYFLKSLLEAWLHSCLIKLWHHYIILDLLLWLLIIIRNLLCSFLCCSKGTLIN